MALSTIFIMGIAVSALVTVYVVLLVVAVRSDAAKR